LSTIQSTIQFTELLSALHRCAGSGKDLGRVTGEWFLPPPITALPVSSWLFSALEDDISRAMREIFAPFWDNWLIKLTDGQYTKSRVDEHILRFSMWQKCVCCSVVRVETEEAQWWRGRRILNTRVTSMNGKTGRESRVLIRLSRVVSCFDNEEELLASTLWWTEYIRPPILDRSSVIRWKKKS